MKLVLGWVLDRRLLGRLPAARLAQFHPVLTAGGRLARLPDPRAALDIDFGTINK